MKTILLATDFSNVARNAANYAADMATACNANLLLLHVYQMPLLFLQVPLPVTIDEMLQDAQKELELIQKELTTRTRGKIAIDTEIRMGSFHDELKTVCERIEPSYLVMGSQGSTAAEHLIFGSHTIYAMKHSTWPLITVPPGTSFSSLKKIALACDFNKEVDEVPLGEIKTLVNDFNAELFILNVCKGGEINPNNIFESGLFSKMLAPVEPHFRFITNEDTDKGIMDFVKTNNIDLLIMLPGRHCLLNRLIHKSNTKQLILNSDAPIMAIHLNDS